MKLTPSVKLGLFVMIVLALLAYVTLRVADNNWVWGGTYEVQIYLSSASGISKKTPVKMAGIRIGVVSGIELSPDFKAKLTLNIQKNITLSQNVVARVKSQGVLGDTYLELFQQGADFSQTLKEGDTIPNASAEGDLNDLTSELNSIAKDVKEMTTSLKTVMAGENSPFNKSLQNIEKITEVLAKVSVSRQEDLNAVISNMKAISENLNLLIAHNVSNVDATLGNVASITGKINNGEGTIGKLVNDETTVEKINESLDHVNSLLGTTDKVRVDLGYHGEYLAGSGEIKNYVSFILRTKPDKYFLFELIDDPSPDTTTTIKDTTITSGGVTSLVHEEIESSDPDKFLFSAQIAKELYGFTFRGGLIESSGGVGLDYAYGPFKAEFSAFDLETQRGESPHLKIMGTVNITPSFYILGGLDDFLNNTDNYDWFLGAGFRLTDDDIKTFLGLLTAGSAMKQ